jgi:hypothetical protein
MTFRAIGFGCHAKGLLAVMTDCAIFTFAMFSLGNLCFFLHLEDFRVTLGTFGLLCVHVCFMAEEDRSLFFGFILYIPSTDFFLSEGNAQGRKAHDANTDDEKPPEFITHFLTSFPTIFCLAHVLSILYYQEEDSSRKNEEQAPLATDLELDRAEPAF